MDNKKRVSLIGLIISILLFLVGVGVAFAAYTYTRQVTVNSKQLVGDIYMHYTESNTLTLSNAMPRSSYIPNSYFEFTIDGKNNLLDGSTNYYPWLSSSSPYTASGVTIYGSNNQICDTF